MLQGTLQFYRQFSALALVAVVALGLSMVPQSAQAVTQIECKAVPGQTPPPPYVVHFETNSVEVKGEYRKRVIEIAERYAGNPNLKVCLTGQADKQGNAEYNEKLALRRAKAVAALMVDHGVKANQIITRTRGEAFTDSLSGSANEADRRVEVDILSR